ncbi:MAG TPA: zinc ribbon domain-containing protein [Nitrospirae bacterium]|nr:zinc ribbon domain-containing protein [Nitrospirota bacterium]
MPIFEYTCQDCKNEFEKLVSGTNPEVSCPKCSSKNTKKKFSVFGMGGGGEKQTSSSGCTSCSTSSCSTCH